jgi:hypothetical protein
VTLAITDEGGRGGVETRDEAPEGRVRQGASVRKDCPSWMLHKECLNGPAGVSGGLEGACEGSAGEGGGEEATADEAAHVSGFCIDTSSATRSGGSDGLSFGRGLTRPSERGRR